MSKQRYFLIELDTHIGESGFLDFVVIAVNDGDDPAEKVHGYGCEYYADGEYNEDSGELEAQGPGGEITVAWGHREVTRLEYDVLSKYLPAANNFTAVVVELVEISCNGCNCSLELTEVVEAEPEDGDPIQCPNCGREGHYHDGEIKVAAEIDNHRHYDKFDKFCTQYKNHDLWVWWDGDHHQWFGTWGYSNGQKFDHRIQVQDFELGNQESAAAAFIILCRWFDDLAHYPLADKREEEDFTNPFGPENYDPNKSCTVIITDKQTGQDHEVTIIGYQYVNEEMIKAECDKLGFDYADNNWAYK